MNEMTNAATLAANAVLEDKLFWEDLQKQVVNKTIELMNQFYSEWKPKEVREETKVVKGIQWWVDSSHKGSRWVSEVLNDNIHKEHRWYKIELKDGQWVASRCWRDGEVEVVKGCYLDASVAMVYVAAAECKFIEDQIETLKMHLERFNDHQ